MQSLQTLKAQLRSKRKKYSEEEMSNKKSRLEKL